MTRLCDIRSDHCQCATSFDLAWPCAVYAAIFFPTSLAISVLPLLLDASIWIAKSPYSTVPSATNNMSRPRRGAAVPAIANTNHSSSVIVSRSPSNSPEECRRSIKLTVKMPSSKLREVTSQSTFGRSIAVNSRDTFEAGEIMTGKRSTRTRATTKLKCYNESDDPDDWDESEESEDEVEVEANSPVEARSTTEEDDEDEDEDEDEEDEVDVATPLAPSKQVPSRPTARPTSQQIPRPQTKSLAKPALVITPAAAAGGPIKSVEEKQMEMENDEAEELSELDSNGEEEEQDERNMDAEGEEDDIGAEEDAEGDEDVDAEGDMESDVGTPGSGMGSPKAQTKRQRGQDEGAFLALPMEPQIKKVLTADEHRMRRAEMARRRKNLSEKRNEEEKVDVAISMMDGCITNNPPDVNH